MSLLLLVQKRTKLYIFHYRLFTIHVSGLPFISLNIGLKLFLFEHFFHFDRVVIKSLNP